MSVLRPLLDVVDVLRGERGCSWDRAQTPASLRSHLIEEAYEVVDAIDRADTEATRDELGDLLFLITMITRIHAERGHFDMVDVVDGITAKMTRRHPHVFSDAAEAPDWESQKRQEYQRNHVLDGIPLSLPPLRRAHRLGSRAAKVGFDWPDIGGVLDKVDEELAELREAMAQGSQDAMEEELGDLLFSITNLARHLGISSDTALRGTNRKFSTRFHFVEQACLADGVDVLNTDLDTLERHWRAAKEQAE